MKTKEILLGAHMSIKGGIKNAIYQSKEIGANILQIFIKNNRRWDFKDFDQKETSEVKTAKKETDIKIIIAHARYLINLGSQSTETKIKSINTLKRELINCSKLKIKYLVVHPGTYQNNKNESLENIARTINNIFKDYNGNTILLIENTAGQGNYLCSNLKEISYLLSFIEKKELIGVCLDTCHAWASGYDFTTKSKYEKFLQEFDNIIGLNNLKLIHINNSKNNLGSKVDRHENIDKGKINIEAFKFIMNDSRLQDIPKILETPHKNIKDIENDINILKKLVIREQ